MVRSFPGLLLLFVFVPNTHSSSHPSPPASLPPVFATAKVVCNSSSVAAPALNVLSWNIDRGTHYDAILTALQRLHPDLALLQEVDSRTTRTQGRDVAEDLAHALAFSEAFGIEFQELSQQEAEGPAAYTGQATLSRLPIRSARILRFRTQSTFWNPRPWIPSSVPFLQRRLGSRIALVTEVERNGNLLVVYNLHLESRNYGRIQLEQLDEVLADFTSHYPSATPVVIGGDLNSKYLPSRYLRKMEAAGFRSALGEQIERTHVIAMALDWVFARSLPAWHDGHVEKSVAGSDHYAITATLPESE